MQEYDHVPVTLPPGLTTRTIAHDPLHLVTSATGPLAGPRPLSELRDAPLDRAGPSHALRPRHPAGVPRRPAVTALLAELTAAEWTRP
jgi:hypothetical protein